MNDYYDYYRFENMLYDEGLFDVILGVIGIVLAVVLVVGIFSIVTYVLRSVGVYTIAKRRGIKHAWLAWIPCANNWVLGSVSDQYRYVAKGQVRNRRVVMLVLACISLVLGVVTNSLSGDLVTQLLNSLMYEGQMGYVEPNVAAVISSAGITVVLSMMNLGVSIALMVFSYMSLYDLYTSCDPKNNVLFLVLGIFFSFTTAFFVFACRKKDLGMPPRRPEPQTYVPPQQPAWQPVTPPEQPTWQPQQPPQEPWEQNNEQ